MKKFILLMLLLYCLPQVSYAGSPDIISTKTIIENQTKIDDIGFKILNSNGIEYRMVFDFDTSKTKNAYMTYKNRRIVVYRGLFDRLKSDDEIASVLSHEISHAVDSNEGILKGYFSFTHGIWFLGARKYEYKADKRAVDFMVNAGYNPVALIVVMSKTFPQERYDWYSSHPLTTKRMMEVYEYIYKKYPEYLSNNPYKNDSFYQNFLLTSKSNRSKFQKKIQSNSKSSVHYK